ncbi:MAG: hypothetical protein JNK12_18175 [Acidimicrobiales bacterium]|nr:hypothetical protein [Acidimicrobiales bacterium]
MPDHTPDSRHDHLSARLDALEASIVDLRSRLDRLRRQLGDEVHTRRLVIAEADGFARVVLSGDATFGSITVRARSVGSGTVAVDVFAADARGGDPAHVGVALIDAGDVVAAVDALAGRPAVVWTQAQPPGPQPPESR